MMDWFQIVVMNAAQFLGTPLRGVEASFEDGASAATCSVRDHCDGGAGVEAFEKPSPFDVLGLDVNPATGLPMLTELHDAGGHLYGSDS